MMAGAQRRAALISLLAIAAAQAPSRGPRPRQAHSSPPRGPGSAPAASPQAPHVPAPLLPWTLLRQRIESGLPNGRLGLVQGQHLFGRAGTGARFVWSGLVRVRIPAQLIRQGEDGWRQDRFPDGWWMETLHRLRVPFKAVVETSGRATDEEHAAHVARLVHRTRPDTVILGNEINAGHRRPGVDSGAVIERYLDRYAAMHAAVKGAAPETRVQLYGEAYDGHPSDPDAFLRHLLVALRRRALPPPTWPGFTSTTAPPSSPSGSRGTAASSPSTACTRPSPSRSWGCAREWSTAGRSAVWCSPRPSTSRTSPTAWPSCAPRAG